MSEIVIWGGALRLIQALLQSAPTILIGLLIASLFRRLVGRTNTFRLFGAGTWRALPQAWLIGMLLPVCSLGVIPIMREMRRCGISGGTILAFGLTAPLFNPISVLYGLTLANPIVILTFSLCSLVIVTVIGLIWDWIFPATAQDAVASTEIPYGFKRIAAVGVTMLREIASPTSIYLVIGLLGVASMSLFLPHGYLQNAAEADNAYAPLLMTAVAIPAYATPMQAMIQLASMFEHGNSVGAAFTLLVLGAGANVGLIAWMVSNYRIDRSLIGFLILVGVVVGLAYGVDKPLYPHGVEAAGHTHAFDVYCCPFHEGTIDARERVFQQLQEDTQLYEMVGLGVFCFMLLAGLAVQMFDRNENIESYLAQKPQKPSRYDIVIPGPVLGGIALTGLVILSVLGCYLYYPPPNEIFEEIKIVNTEVVAAARTQDWDTALYWIPIYEDWIRKLQVSVYLRGKPLTEFHRLKARILLEKIELLEHAVEDQFVKPATELSKEVDRSYRRLKKAMAELI